MLLENAMAYKKKRIFVAEKTSFTQNRKSL
jgi:hypothetical protein